MVGWLPLLSLGLLPIELLLLQLIFTGGTSGPAPQVEILLLWSLAVLLPQLQGNMNLPIGLFKPLIAISQLPILFWLDQRAGAFSELIPWHGQSRFTCLFWALVLLLTMQWQLRSVLGLAIAIKPNQSDADQQSSGLDAKVAEGNSNARGTAHCHGGSANSGGSEKSEPQSPA